MTSVNPANRVQAAARPLAPIAPAKRECLVYWVRHGARSDQDSMNYNEGYYVYENKIDCYLSE